MIVETDLSNAHLELVRIFFTANELDRVYVNEYQKNIRGMTHVMLQLSWDDNDEETASKITYMAIVHLGINNMLDDYLMKCGVDVWHLPPASIKAQERKEQQEQKDKEFNEYFNQRKQSI